MLNIHKTIIVTSLSMALFLCQGVHAQVQQTPQEAQYRCLHKDSVFAKHQLNCPSNTEKGLYGGNPFDDEIDPPTSDDDEGGIIPSENDE